MINIHIKLIAYILILTPPISFGYETELDDPRNRDEDISNTKIISTYKILPNGNYEYIYDISSSKLNKGIIDTFELDISCDDDLSSASYSEPFLNMFRNTSINGKHIPVQAFGVKNATYWLSITGDNYLMWGVQIEPNRKVQGFRVISPVAPGGIRYILEPAMDADGWDYITYPVTNADVLDISDFTVTGMTIGPACPSKSKTFPGTNRNEQESDEINNLLTYSMPLRDRFHVKKGTTSLPLTIHYSENIDPQTFKVKPHKIKNLFNPIPGTTQTIDLPLKKDHHKKYQTSTVKFKFEVSKKTKAITEERHEENGMQKKKHSDKSESNGENRKDKKSHEAIKRKADKERKKTFKIKDKDEFVIIIDK